MVRKIMYAMSQIFVLNSVDEGCYDPCEHRSEPGMVLDPEWQAKERAADEDNAAADVMPFETAEELVTYLRSLDDEHE
jgi:hypothetical protein